LIVNRSIVRAGALLILTWLGLALFFYTSAGRRLELYEFDLLTVISTPRNLDVPVVIIGIDETSFAELQYQWPWPRQLHARLVDELRKAGAAVIAFDVVFAEHSAPEGDEQFAEAIKRAGNVVLAGDIVLQERDQFSQIMKVDPLNQFLVAGALTGVAAVTLDADLVVRQIPRAGDAFWRQIVRLYQDKIGVSPYSSQRLGPDSRVRYLGADHAFRYVSYYQALNAREMLPEGFFKNQIVLIGFDTKASPEPGVTQTDAFSTPFLPITGYLTPGVEVHATFIANALLNRNIRELSRIESLLETALVLLLTLICLLKWRPLQSLFVVMGISAMTAIFDVWLFGMHDLWIPSVSAMIAPMICYVQRGGVAFLSEQKQRIQMRRAFQQYVAPEIVAEIIRHPEKLTLGGERRYLTIMFTDLQGFSSISECLEPEQVSNLLIRHFSEMTKIIHDYGGTVDKFIGDAIMAFWGAPLADTEQALHACQAAMAMQVAAAVMRQELVGREFPGIYMRIGIHTGDAIVGNMGSKDRFDYTAVGDNVNVASRLEGINKLYGTQILISESTAKDVSACLPIMHVDKVRVKGKTMPIDIYTLPADPDLPQKVEAAIQSYRSKQWDVAERQWQTLIDIPAVNAIAEIYLARIGELRRQELPTDWDGAVSLEKM